MTKIQHSTLEPLEHILSTAYKSDYARVSPSEWRVLSDVYKELFGVALTKSQENCSTCRLNAIKRIAREYYSYKPAGRKTSQSKVDSNNGQQNDAE